MKNKHQGKYFLIFLHDHLKIFYSNRPLEMISILKLRISILSQSNPPTPWLMCLRLCFSEITDCKFQFFFIYIRPQKERNHGKTFCFHLFSFYQINTVTTFYKNREGTGRYYFSNEVRSLGTFVFSKAPGNSW